MSKVHVRVNARGDEAEGIASFELVNAMGGELPEFSAGAHIDVHVAPGIVRQYSLCNDPVERHRYRIAVLRESSSRGGSAGMHQINPGDALTIGTPRNLFPLVQARHTLLVAGGIGITPILSMARALHAQGCSFELHYAARSTARMAFKGELESSPFASFVHLYAGDTGPSFDAPSALASPAPDTRLYVCGPAGFMEHVIDAALRAGWPKDHLHREYFAAPEEDTSGDSAFEIRLARSGIVCQVPAKGTVLEALLSAGVDLPFSCEAGVCGSCVTRVLDGLPDHRDTFLTDAERAANDQFTPCCSRSKTRTLVLDL